MKPFPGLLLKVHADPSVGWLPFVCNRSPEHLHAHLGDNRQPLLSPVPGLYGCRIAVSRTPLVWSADRRAGAVLGVFLNFTLKRSPIV